MEKKVKVTSPRYQQIAADVAAKIADKHYQVGDKLFARSALASQYGVSAETARRAICVLSDMQIVNTTKGSGVIITSYENAVKFVKTHEDIETVNDLRNDIIKSIERQNNENEFLKEQIRRLIDKTSRFKSINPFIPFEITIDPTSTYVGKNLSDVNFWHNTLATVVGIKREDSLLMSPGPYSVITEGDILYFVGDENCYERVLNFLYQN
ncbi:GntR family transcriptional regulator [Alkalibaculum sp. M08DMB]|uniref:GntR family transcriptional regulator n=1 Tax=Alkalibaculum sporogenes TaxID=2655001 RepID=A0A6A7K8U7_9FIRM|nr:TrkA C-terminal domain-containing protein [Alkalibaculum sporogenes]MPW25822.1 GntR family transcriptional regulator [Alkalibaculum sporogenes]